MPKIIDDIKTTIIAEAKRQLLCGGYSGMTLRSVACACNIAVGTIYNYFKSKDALIASFMLDDWKEAIAKMEAGCAADELPTAVFACIYRELMEYSDKYTTLFADAGARRSADGTFPARHALLRSQIASLLTNTCRKYALHDTDYLPEFIAEAILSHTAERRELPALSEILVQLFRPMPSDALPTLQK